MNAPENSTDLDNKRIFPELKGVGYLLFLNGLHKKLKPKWYLEIGVLRGESLKMASANTIAVDPKFNLTPGSFEGKKEMHLFQTTSDEFFASGRVDAITKTIDFAFLDGMHLFEYLLRDFINTEKISTTSGKIAMHDCIPITAIAAERDWDRSRTAAWTGDVWKLVPILKKYRPDLKIEVFDCPPSGLTLVSNLDPKNTVLSDNYDSIIEEFMDKSIESFGAEDLLETLQIQSSLPKKPAPVKPQAKT